MWKAGFGRNNNVNNNLQGDAIAAAIDVLNEERVIAYPTEPFSVLGAILIAKQQ